MIGVKRPASRNISIKGRRESYPGVKSSSSAARALNFPSKVYA